MYKITIVSVHKTKESWLQEAIFEYEKRLKSLMPVEWIFVKTTEHLDPFLENIPFVALDLQGKEYSSEEFQKKLYEWQDRSKSRLTFLIGGADGIPKHLLDKAISSLRLSKMTFTHQIARLVLIEQIYRATQIYQNTPYHK